MRNKAELYSGAKKLPAHICPGAGHSDAVKVQFIEFTIKADHNERLLFQIRIIIAYFLRAIPLL